MSSHNTPEPQTYASPLHYALLVIGGLLLATGLLNLYWSFGWPNGPFSSDFSQIGFSGLDNISILSAADYAFPAIVTGVLCMAFANATAWRHTGGY